MFRNTFANPVIDFLRIIRQVEVPQWRQFWFWWNRLKLRLLLLSSALRSISVTHIVKLDDLSPQSRMLPPEKIDALENQKHFKKSRDLCIGEMQSNNGGEGPWDWCWPPNEVLEPEKHLSPRGSVFNMASQAISKRIGSFARKFTSIAKNRMFSAIFGIVNDFPCQHEFSFAKQIQTSILDETIFGSVGGQVWQYFPPNIGIPVQWWSYTKGYCSLFYVFK